MKRQATEWMEASATHSPNNRTKPRMQSEVLKIHMKKTDNPTERMDKRINEQTLTTENTQNIVNIQKGVQSHE